MFAGNVAAVWESNGVKAVTNRPLKMTFADSIEPALGLSPEEV